MSTFEHARPREAAATPTPETVMHQTLHTGKSNRRTPRGSIFNLIMQNEIQDQLQEAKGGGFNQTQ